MIDTRLVAELARELQIAKQEPSSPYIPFNRDNNPSAYPNGDDDEDGEDGEPVQLELPLAKKWGAIQHENGEWLMPTKEGTFRSATEEETIMLADTRNLQKGPPPVRGLGDIINQQAETYRGKDNDKMLELQKIAAPLIRGV